MNRATLFKAQLMIIVLLAIGACAQLGGSPESQIKTGADSLTATTTLATVLLRNDRITVDQAKSYRVMLGAASTALDDSNKTLLDCRKKTGSTQAATPDPCQPAVADVIKVALDSITNVKKTLDQK